MEELKLVCRVVHMISGGFLAGTTILNYFFYTNEFLVDDPDYFDFAHPLAGVLALISGIALVFLLKPAKKEEEAQAEQNGAQNTKDEKDEKDQPAKPFDKSSLYPVWGDLLKVKLAFSMLLTPLVDPLVLFLMSWSDDTDSDDLDYSFSDDAETNALQAK